MTSRTQRNSDERGSTLVLVLVFLCVVGVSSSAVLNLQSTTFRAQTAITEKAVSDVAAENALNSAIQVLRRDKTGEAGRDNAMLAAGCNRTGAADDLVHFTAGGSDVHVQCRSTPASGQRSGGDAELPEQVIVTLGGATGDGPDAGEANSGEIPFCDDFHARDSGSCEAGFYLGRVEETIPGEGGLVVDGNGGTGEYLIKSNSSIIVRDGGDSDRAINVDGGVWARRACSGRVIAHYLSQDPSQRTADCPGKDDTARSLMTTDDCTGGRVPDESCFPYLPRQGELDALRTFGEPAWMQVADATNPFNPTRRPPARMIPRTVPTCPAANAPGYLIFEPGYYNDLDALDDRMDNCGDTLFYFAPGAYYFDFSPTSAQNAWTEPNGANGKLSQIVGGTGTTTGEGAWLPCNVGQNAGGPGSEGYDAHLPGGLALGQCPPQPEKHMRFKLSSQSNQWSKPVNTLAIDGKDDKATTNNTAAFIKWDQPQVRLPERSGTTVQRLTATIAYQSPSGQAQYASGWPRLSVQLPGGASCDFRLDTFTTSDLVSDTFVLFTNRPGETATPCSTKTSGWDAKLAAAKTDPALINGMTLIYEVKSKQFQPPQVEGHVDGVSVGVEYTGRPAPDFPGGCDPRGDGGVQFVFGGNARMNFNANNAFVELCGRKSSTADNVPGLPVASGGGKYAIAVYGVSEFSADPPRRAVTRSLFTDVPNGSNLRFPLMSVAQPGTPGTVDGSVLKSETWSTNAPANLDFNVSMNANGATDTIPSGSVITGAEVRVRHAEGTPPDAGGISSNTNVIGSMKLVITPGTSGVGSNGRTAGVFSTSVPKCGDFSMPATNPACDFRFGSFGESPASPSPSTPTFQAKTNPCWADRAETAMKSGTFLADFNSAFTTTGFTTATCDWYDARGRDLLDAMSTPEAWTNANVQLQYNGNQGGANKVAWVDGIELTVYYRPPGTLRPLSGCITTRAGHNPYANAERNNVGATDPATQLMGVDSDWGARTQTPGLSDESYTSGTNAADTEACALIRMTSSQTSGVKLHVRGMIYAPTAAVDLNGKDNEAPFVTDGLIVRHLTTWRWRTGLPRNAFGKDVGDRNNRLVWLSVTKDGQTVARELVEIDDQRGRAFGTDAIVREFVLRPENTDARCGC